MSGERRCYPIYGPAHFRATWAKFLEICERDGQSGSQLVRIWVEGYVQRKDPGNPQRPLTAWEPGHPDEEARVKQDHFKWFLEFAGTRGNEIRYLDILFGLRLANVPPAKRTDMADDMAKRLSKDKVKVLR